MRKSRDEWQSLLLPLGALLLLTMVAANCRRMTPEERLIPQALSEVPAQYLAYRFAPDTEPPPEAAAPEEVTTPAVQANFDTGRPTDALLRTVVSPDGQRVLALYATAEMPQGIFRIDMYAADGKFLRNITAPELACAFTPSVAWSPDGQWFAFIARRNETLIPTPAPNAAAKSDAKKNAPEADPPFAEAAPTPTLGPRFAPIETYATEQIYLSDRDGFNIRPVTTDEESIFFNFTWAPNGRADAMAALACGEAEWQARVTEGQLPAGRPRLLLMAGGERLLDDRLTEVEPVWSPDASKIATAFENEVTIYDASINPSTGARIALRDALLEASVRYDAERLQPSATTDPPVGETKPAAKKGARAAPTPTPSPVPAETPAPSVPLSFNSIVRLEWPRVETLYAETGFVRVYANETVSSYLRWHTLNLSPQAILLKRT